MKILDLNKNNFDSEVLNSKTLVLVDFNADWCGPCRMLRPILEEISGDRNSFKIASVNVDEEEELAIRYNVSSIPCLILFKEGKEIKRSVGLRSKEDILDMMGEE